MQMERDVDGSQTVTTLTPCGENGEQQLDGYCNKFVAQLWQIRTYRKWEKVGKSLSWNTKP